MNYFTKLSPKDFINLKGVGLVNREMMDQYYSEKDNLELLAMALRRAFRVEFQMLEDMYEYNLRTVLMTCENQIISKTSISNVVLYEAQNPDDVMNTLMRNLRKAAELYRRYRARTTHWSHYLWADDWNSQLPPLPKLTMHRWDPSEQKWLKVDGVEDVGLKEN